MAPYKNYESLANGAVDQSQSVLLRLPNELVDQILDDLFIFRGPIEFSPIDNNEPAYPRHKGMDLCQYQHALDYQNHVRPALRALRLCKTIYAGGVWRYYSMNNFHFSGLKGMLVLTRFFDLVGANNIELLRDITVVHPLVALDGLTTFDRGDPDMPPDSDLWDFFTHRLSPFGMADIKGFSDCYVNEAYGVSIPLHDPLEVLRGIAGLKNLSFLLYPQPPFSSDPLNDGHEITHSVFIEGLVSWGLGMGNERLKDWEELQEGWRAPLGLNVTLVNMYQLPEADNKPVLLRAIQAGEAEAPDSYSAFAAQSIIKVTQSKGWKIRDLMFCPTTGAWPVNAEDFEENFDEWLDKRCDDREGWNNREYLGDGHAYFEGCVECWRDACHCDDGGKYLPRDWQPAPPTEKLFIPNPGVPVEVDISRNGGLVWKRSEAVKEHPKMLRKAEEDRTALNLAIEAQHAAAAAAGCSWSW